MNCFTHNQVGAVGVCRNCFKGICAECATDFQDGIACSEHCLEKAKATVQVVSNSVLAQRGAKTGRFIAPIFLLVLGSIYMGYSYFANEIFGFGGASGLGFFVMGLVMLVYNRRFFKPIKD